MAQTATSTRSNLLRPVASHFSSNRSSGASSSLNNRRLRRPAGYKDSNQESNAQDPSSTFEFRSNTVTLFPGNFGDQDSMWDDDDDDDFFDNDGKEEIMASDLLQRALKKKDEEKRLQKEKWIENSKPPVRKPIIDERGRAYGKGGRKAAHATVFIQPGLGEIVVNNQDFIDYFQRSSDRDHVLTPLVITETVGAWDVKIKVMGGGLTGQAGAARLGIANALNAYNPNLYRPPLKRMGLLERDARKVERKKIGRLKARKSPQWVRR
eukprot:scaffold1060_cov196-Amphora_coffeaeformis.AAC.11